MQEKKIRLLRDDDFEVSESREEALNRKAECESVYTEAFQLAGDTMNIHDLYVLSYNLDFEIAKLNGHIPTWYEKLKMHFNALRCAISDIVFLPLAPLMLAEWAANITIDGQPPIDRTLFVRKVGNDSSQHPY